MTDLNVENDDVIELEVDGKASIIKVEPIKIIDLIALQHTFKEFTI